MSPVQEWACVLHSPPFLSFKLYRSLGRLAYLQICCAKFRLCKVIKNFTHSDLLLSSRLRLFVTVRAVLLAAVPSLYQKFARRRLLWYSICVLVFAVRAFIAESFTPKSAIPLVRSLLASCFDWLLNRSFVALVWACFAARALHCALFARFVHLA